MVEGVLNLVPGAKVGHIGLYRDPDTFQPVEYYCKLPVDAQERELIILDPMLATGGSASGRNHAGSKSAAATTSSWCASLHRRRAWKRSARHTGRGCLCRGRG